MEGGSVFFLPLNSRLILRKYLEPEGTLEIT